VMMPCKRVKMCSAYPWKHKFLLLVGRLSCTPEVLTHFLLNVFSVSERERISFQQHSPVHENFVRHCPILVRAVTPPWPTVSVHVLWN
jgi:hypothetical protein